VSEKTVVEIRVTDQVKVTTSNLWVAMAVMGVQLIVVLAKT
jgi:hypothetical protein